MHRRIGRRRREPNPEKDAAKEALKLAFRHEVRPEEYFLRVWATAAIVGIVLCYFAASKTGSIDLGLLIPFGGWHPRDSAGELYLVTWGTILVNSLKVGFLFWGGILLFLGLWRAFNKDKYIFACFYLSFAFIGFALVLPGWTESLLNMLIEKYPALVS